MVAFLDVGLKESLETCVIALWNKMQPEGILFCQEAPRMENVGIFWDVQFWKDYMNVTSPPGFIGGGTGLPLLVSGGVIGSALGYAIR